MYQEGCNEHLDMEQAESQPFNLHRESSFQGVNKFMAKYFKRFKKSSGHSVAMSFPLNLGFYVK